MSAPQVGQIVEHQFLWIEERDVGLVEGRKARPCLIIAVEPSVESAQPRVTVLPITSQPPRSGSTMLAVPNDIKGRIGLDRRRSAWIVLDQANSFTWPGFDLVPQADGSFVRGIVTRGFFISVREAISTLASRGGPRIVERDE
jgi:hypothetical protein